MIQIAIQIVIQIAIQIAIHNIAVHHIVNIIKCIKIILVGLQDI